jgi:hypothetical protein
VSLTPLVQKVQRDITTIDSGFDATLRDVSATNLDLAQIAASPENQSTDAFIR